MTRRSGLAVVVLLLLAVSAAWPELRPLETGQPEGLPHRINVPPPRGTEMAPRTAAGEAVAPRGWGDGPPVLTVSLVDGSRLRGTSSLSELTLHSDALGKLTVALQRIATVKFGKPPGTVTLSLQNGDRIQAGLVDTKLVLTSVVGVVHVPLDKVLEMRLSRGGGPLEWNIVPFPQNSDWPGPRGKPSLVTAEEVVSCGQPVRSTQSFNAPAVFECEVVLDELVTNDGAIWINLVPKDAEAHLNPPPATVTVQLGYSHPGGRNGGLSVDGLRLTKRPMMIEPGKSYRLAIEVLTDKIRVSLDGQEYVAEGVTAPADGFQIRLMGWQPNNVWRVRDFRAR